MRALLDRINRLLPDEIGAGDRLGEAFYAVWMSVASIGLVNATGSITPDRIWTAVAVAFAVNLVWGTIDGVTVAHTNVIERAERERIVSALADGHDPDARDQARAALADTIVDGLGDDEIDRILDAIASSAPPARPARHGYPVGRDDWLYALGIVAIDVGLVVPVVLPLILVSNSSAALYISRLVAAVMFAAIGWGYARNLNRNPWLAAIVLGGLGFGLFTGAYAAGW